MKGRKCSSKTEKRENLLRAFQGEMRLTYIGNSLSRLTILSTVLWNRWHPGVLLLVGVV